MPDPRFPVPTPGLRVYTNKSLAAQIRQSGVAPGARIHAVGDGDRFEVGGIPVSVHGEWHALIHKDIPRIRNVGFIVGARVTGAAVRPGAGLRPCRSG
jgi:hypothetical protein